MKTRPIALRLRTTGFLTLLLAFGLPVGPFSPVGPPGLLSAQEAADDPFPHLEHEGLFPLCTGCHGGTQTSAADLYPDASLCVQCHDGVEEERVTWTRPSDRATNVLFEHDQHAADLLREGDSAQTCTSCHAASPEDRWDVSNAVTGTCWGCHEHERPTHYEGGECIACHVPLSESTVGTASFREWSPPADHDAPEFLTLLHGQNALDPGGFEGCTTCHTRERCTSCHVNGAIEPISSLGFAPSTIGLLHFEAVYPVPGSHQFPNWLEDHNTVASVTDCATCHTRQDCMSCHVTPVPTAVNDVPNRAGSLAPGVGLTRVPPPTHERPSFAQSHAADAASDDRLCASCHQPVTCVSCHLGGSRDEAPEPAGTAVATATVLRAGDARPTVAHPAEPRTPEALPARESGGFHPPAFDLRHAADAWGATLECASCHNTTVFCRSCHIESGLGSEGRLGRGYHDAVGPWLLKHGQAARQSLESCASCHRQQECMQCHSTTGGFRVNPHGDGFDADLAWEKGKRTCQACHRSDPIGGGA